jgi:tetratricopeptide (TPR) repeat protein
MRQPPRSPKTRSSAGSCQHHSYIPHLQFRLALASLVVLFVVAAGCSPANLVRRARHIPRRLETELHQLRPHAEFVPTPALSHARLPVPPAERRTPSPEPTAAARAVSHAAQVGQIASERRLRAGQPAGPIVQATPTALPPTAQPDPTPSPPPAVVLAGVTHAWQTWNNCGPATLAMDLSYFARPETQADAAAVLKPDADDKNVSPYELADYARSVGLKALWRVDGDVNLLEQLLSHNLPVIVEAWIEPKPNDGMGHYRLVVGYDNAAGQFTTYDSLDGPDVVVPFTQFDAEWRVFNRTYIIVYPPEQHDVVARLLGDAMEAEAAYRNAAARAEAAIEATPDDAFAWFNLGSSLSPLGDHTSAAAAFDQARVLGLPWRMLWYQFGPFESYFAVERYADVLALADANLRNAGNLEESHYWRGRALVATDQPDAARQAFERALNFNPNFVPAQQALTLLPETR